MPHNKVQFSIRKIKDMTPYPPPERLWPELRQLIDNFHFYARQASKTAPRETSRAASELAILLHAMGRSSGGGELLEICLEGLVRSGDLGLLLVHDLIVAWDLPFKAIRPIISAWSPLNQLTLADLALGYREGQDSDLKAWARNRLDTLSLDNPSEPLAFLRALEARGLSAHPAVAKALLDGVMAPYLSRTMSQPPAGPDSLLDLLAVIRPLRAGFLAVKLARFLKSDDQSVLGPVLEAVAACVEPGNRTVILETARLLGNAAPGIRLTAIETLIAAHSPEIDLVFIHLAGKNPAQAPALALRLPLAGGRTFRNVMEGVAPEVRDRMLVAVFTLLCRLWPARVAAIMRKTLADGLGPHLAQEAAAMLRGLVPETHPPLPPDIPERTPGARPVKAAPPAPRKSGLLSKLFGQSREEQVEDELSRTMSGSDIMGTAFDRRDLSSVRFMQTRFVKAVFTDCEFDGTDFSKAVFQGVTFRNCRFHRARLPEALFDNATLESCTFALCDFAGAAWRGGRIQDSTFSDCFMSGTVMLETEIMQTGFARVSLENAAHYGLRYSCGRMVTVDLSGYSATRCQFNGVSLQGCLIRNARLYDSEFLGTPLSGCLLFASEAKDLLSDEVALLNLEDSGLREGLRRNERLLLDETAKAEGLPAEVLAILREIVGSWFKLRDMRRSERVFLSHNALRSAWAARKTTEAKADFLRLTPYLIHSDVFDRQERIIPVPPACLVSGYTPDLDTVELARRYFPQAACAAPRPDALRIEAVYTIGSVGSVAQTSRSDLDYWVCCDFRNRDPADISGLRAKLDRLTTFAETRFGVEAHFFLMDVDAVQANDFGASDTESSGSAQALMLKEEFYRTALRCAGKELAWWLVQPGCDDLDYMEALWLLSASPEERKFVDLGNLRDIPPEEFFGASLWQIVKAFKNPFKSLMKFALLEKYVTRANAHGGYLCDRIKANLLAGETDLLEIDPYAVMFKETGDYYRETGDKPALALLQLSFNLKTDIARGAQIDPPHGLTWKNLLDELASGPRGLGADMPDTENVSQWSFNNYFQIGNFINAFMLKTYKKIQDRASSRSSSVLINSSDLTRLGRKIFTTFARRQYKVERMPFIASHPRFFSELHFSAETAKGGKRVWAAHGHKADEAIFRFKLMEIRRQPDLSGLLAWLIANNIFAPGMLVKTDASMLPVMAGDIQDLLLALRNFFPDGETFDTPMDESLKPERVIKAFFVLNLTAPREKEDILEASVIYSTNWGEFFCLTQPVTDPNFQVQPEEFLARHVPQDTSIRPAMDYFSPERSRCPAPLIY